MDQILVQIIKHMIILVWYLWANNLYQNLRQLTLRFIMKWHQAVGINIDLSGNACDFNIVKWIGEGHICPINPLPELLAYKEAMYEIPPQ